MGIIFSKFKIRNNSNSSNVCPKNTIFSNIDNHNNKLYNNKSNRISISNIETNHSSHPFQTNIYHYPISITEDHRIIDGRVFHNRDNAPYFFPTDNIENLRSNLLHEVVIQKWGNHHSAPVEEKLKRGTARVLDAG